MPPMRLDDEILRLLLANMRNPDERRGDLRAQIAAHRLAETRLDELVRAARPRPRRRGDGRALRLLGADRPGGDRASCRTAATRPSDVLEPVEGELEIRAAVTIAGDELEIDFAGTSPQQHDGQPQLPARRHPLGRYFVVRCLTAPDVPASGGAFAPVTRRALRTAASSTRRRRHAVVAGQHRDVEPDRRRPLRGLRPGDPGARRRARGR